MTSTLIHNLRLSSIDLNAISLQSAAHTATSSHSTCATGLTPGFNSLMKNSLNVCKCKSGRNNTKNHYYKIKWSVSELNATAKPEGYALLRKFKCARGQ